MHAHPSGYSKNIVKRILTYCARILLLDLTYGRTITHEQIQ